MKNLEFLKEYEQKDRLDIFLDKLSEEELDLTKEIVVVELRCHIDNLSDLCNYRDNDFFGEDYESEKLFAEAKNKEEELDAIINFITSDDTMYLMNSETYELLRNEEFFRTNFDSDTEELESVYFYDVFEF
jgi:hypothetical protein